VIVSILIHPSAQLRLPTRRQECLQVTGWYLVAILLLHCLMTFPTGLQPGRHSHATVSSDAAMATPAAQWLHRVGSAQHSHDGHAHSHGANSSDIQPLGEEADAGASLQLLPGAPWPAALVWAVVKTSERFSAQGGLQFSSRSCSVLLQPPRDTDAASAALRG